MAGQFSYGTLTYQDAYRRRQTIRFKGPISRNASHVGMLMINFAPYTDCVVRRRTVHLETVEQYPLTGNISRQAAITMVDMYGETHCWLLPGYIGPSARDKHGEFVPITTLLSFVSFIQAYTGNIGLNPLRSPIISG